MSNGADERQETTHMRVPAPKIIDEVVFPNMIHYNYL